MSVFLIKIYKNCQFEILFLKNIKKYYENNHMYWNVYNFLPVQGYRSLLKAG